jgi:hypothetical protein
VSDRRSRIPVVWILLLLTASGQAASAQPWRLEEALKLPERLLLEADFRTRYEYLDNQFRADVPGSDQLLALRTRIRARLGITDWLGVGAEFQDSRAYLADSNTPVGTSEVNAAELLRAYLEFTFDDPLFDGRHRAQLGRLTMDIGSRRLVARNRYRNTSNAFTGLDWRWSTDGGREVRAFYTLPVQRLPSERAQLVNNDIAFDRNSFDFQFWGLFYGDVLPWGDALELYLYGLHEREVYDATDGVSTRKRRLFTPGFRLLRAPRVGHFTYEIEVALQPGRSGSTAVARDVDHFAHQEHLSFGYTFDVAWTPQLILHYVYGSGDRDPTDSSNQRFDSLFGARRFEFGPTSLYGAFSRSNINTPGLRLHLAPHPKWSGFIDYRAVWLASATDEWVPTGVRDPTGRSGSFVGSQIELAVRWRPLPGNVLLDVGYAHLFAGEFIDEAPNSNGGDSNYVYTQILLQF